MLQGLDTFLVQSAFSPSLIEMMHLLVSLSLLAPPVPHLCRIFSACQMPVQ